MTTEAAETPVTPALTAKQSGQNPRSSAVEAGHHWVVDVDLEAFLDGWIRRHLRQILWLQWKRAFTRAKNLMRLGLSEERAWNTAQNGRGSWWNAGSQYLNRALPLRLFARIGLISLVSFYHQLKRFT